MEILRKHGFMQNNFRIVPTLIIMLCTHTMRIGKMVNDDLNDYATIDSNTKTKTPLLNLIPHGLYHKRIDRHQNLVTKLTDPRFDSLRTNKRYQILINLVNE